MREDGFYWVRVDGQWRVAEWADGRWLLAGMGGGFAEGFMEAIDERPISRGSPIQSPTEAMLEAGYLALRNSSWHEMSPTELDLALSDWRPIFEEVFLAMAAVQPAPFGVPVAWRRRPHNAATGSGSAWVLYPPEDADFYASATDRYEIQALGVIQPLDEPQPEHSLTAAQHASDYKMMSVIADFLRDNPAHPYSGRQCEEMVLSARDAALGLSPNAPQGDL